MIVAETKHVTVGKGRIVLAQASWKNTPERIPQVFERAHKYFLVFKLPAIG